ncbi:MAG: preprotein translocase [Thiomonas sp. 20-64-9]|jgi:integrase|uniref:tyrosine-type recombinase/integrase n=1 Tax=unclassified Thiomonas TaxID=2625466 RepID=UPI000BD84252|nr:MULTISPECIES: integrase family protein [unclassified Thiomonas]OYV29278.1 MAG: preprotein translocase [Thiomonas sp. 20-64-9]OZB71689.1 MAG: preprotein translocase [Thiomonas sp. 13-64-67]
MAKLNLTAARIESATCEVGKQQSILWDAKSPGLGLRVTASGARAYVFESRLFRKTIRVTIGDARAWDLGSARTEAARLKTLIDAGQDPRDIRARQAEAHEVARAQMRRQTLVVKEAWDAYLEARKSKWSERHYIDHVRLADAGGRSAKRGVRETIPGPLATFMPMRMADLTIPVVDEWLAHETVKRPTRARLAFALLRAFITWCQEQEQFANVALAGICSNRRIRERLPRTKAKTDCLQREQLAAWFRAVRSISNPVISAYLQGLLITGARREELAGLRWADVDFRWRSITLDDKVEGAGGRTIPLTPYLCELLLDLKRRSETPPTRRRVQLLEDQGKAWSPSPWVFSSKTSADGRLVEPRAAHTKALSAAQLPHLTLHGLRRSFGTLSEWVEVPVGVVAQIQGHKPSAIAEKHYRRRPLDLLRVWHEKIEVWLLEQADIGTSG